jgi:hypothetical protein
MAPVEVKQEPPPGFPPVPESDADRIQALAKQKGFTEDELIDLVNSCGAPSIADIPPDKALTLIAILSEIETPKGE